jgi:hypothetical protein
VSSTISIEFDPLDEGVSREKWETWAREHGLRFEPGNGNWYGGEGRAQIEAGYAGPQRSIRFSTFWQGPGMGELAQLALLAWTEFGGAMSASPELSRLVTLRYAGAGAMLEMAGKLQRELS